MKRLLLYCLTIAMTLSFGDAQAQRKRNKNAPKAATTYPLQAFKMRNVGPAFLSGRIADIALDPTNDNIWYVAVGSGGVWKTVNAGTTWTPVFDQQASYSTGCITVDPNNPARIWVGTGENVGGRHVGYGDGVYLSEDYGKTWKNMGLKATEHISKIIVHPDNSDVIFVAAQGPLWSKGGERGLYKTTDGGKNWNRVLGNAEWTGVTDIIMDAEHPQTLYAATWDRHRTVAAYMGGGPGSGLHRSTDGGETWEALSNGLPTSNLGKIGIAQSPQRPEVLYAAIELDRKKGAVYRSEDRGSSWTKMSNTVSGGTGPHYYQELYASPHKFDRLYLMNVRVLTSEDGGKTFNELQERQKHSDNHVLVFKQDDPDYLMLGTDAGIYESFDLAQNWRYIKNLPLTQFYKVAVNNAEPFYHIFGGTQDNGSAGGPSATDEREGIANKHWYKTLSADGHQSATDPVYNDIIYAETQQGGLHRVDLSTGERVFIQPQAREGDPHERFNWDAPILVSPHNPARLYFASYRVWKSENRGDDWDPISGDLTRNEERLTLPIMGRQQSWDNPWDVGAMSNYNTITSLSESALKEGLIYAGTDDGFIQVTQDGGQNWTQIPVTRLGLPARSFVNDIKADLFDVNTVYVALDNHKEGDFNPYLFKSTDRGATWQKISQTLPDRTLVWRMVQDPVRKSLLFAATEFGIYTSFDTGANWQKLPGTPTIPFRDLTIQQRENDLVAASFGRGFFVLDDYSPLREMTAETLTQKAKLFAPRTAKWYVPKSEIGNTGADYYFAENPTFGAVFTVYFSEGYTSMKQARQKQEKKLNDKKANVPFPGWEALQEEQLETPPGAWIAIQDAQGNVVQNVSVRPKKGTQRLAWNLRHSSTRPIRMGRSGGRGYGFGGPLAMPGTYTASLFVEENGAVNQVGEAVSFEVKPLREGVLKGISYEEFDAYRTQHTALMQESYALEDALIKSNTLLKAYKQSAERTTALPGALMGEIAAAEKALQALNEAVEGNAAREEVGERNPPNVSTHLSVASRGLSTTYGPTALHKKSLKLAQKMMQELAPQIQKMNSETLPALETKLKAAGAPYIMGSK